MADGFNTEISPTAQNHPESENMSPQDRLNHEIRNMLLSPAAQTVFTPCTDAPGMQDELRVACSTDSYRTIIANAYTLQRVPVESRDEDMGHLSLPSERTKAVTVAPSISKSVPDDTTAKGKRYPYQAIHFVARDEGTDEVFSVEYSRRGANEIPQTIAIKCDAGIEGANLSRELFEAGGFRYATDLTVLKRDLREEVTDEDYTRLADFLKENGVNGGLTRNAANYDPKKLPVALSQTRELPPA